MTMRPYEYAVLRVVPRVDRDEFVNAGIILYCQADDFLGCSIALDDDRLRALDPAVDIAGVTTALEAVAAVSAGDPSAGEAAMRDARERFRWLIAPRSTVVQAGPVHGGLTDDPAGQLEHLVDRQVR